jgi:NADH-quinone oxidoreductase subunit A
MTMEPNLSEFGIALLYLVVGLVFVAGGLLTNWLIRPHRPNAEKGTPYECGEQPEGSAWVRFNMRFYVMGLIFLVFDVELLLLFPWATVFASVDHIRAAPSWGWVAFAEAFAFIAVLAAGLAYIWIRGDIEWVRPAPVVPQHPTPAPAEAYQALNQHYLAPRVAPQPAPHHSPNPVTLDA